MKTPDFTIGITFFDRDSLLMECLESCSTQVAKKDSFEVILINDNPNKNMNYLVDLFPELTLRVVNHSLNHGEVFSMNEALMLAEGKYFSWLADDDKISPLYICNSLNLLSSQKEIDVLYFSYTTDQATFVNSTDIRPLPVVQTYSLENELWIADYISGKYKFIGIYGAFKTSSLRAFGGFADIISHKSGLYADTLFPILFSSKFNSLFIPLPYFFFRIHSNSFSNMFDHPLILVSSQISFLKLLKRRVRSLSLLHRSAILNMTFRRFTQDAWSVSCRRFNSRLIRLTSYSYSSFIIGFNIIKIYPIHTYLYIKIAFSTIFYLKQMSEKL